MMLDSIDNGLLVYPTVEENGQTRPKKYFELTEAQKLQDDCDTQATNIILHGLPPDVYALVNHQETAKDIWDKVKMLMKGTELSDQEHSGLVVPMFQQGEDLIECIDKAMEFLFVVASRFPPSNNQLRTSFNPRNQATIQDGRVTVQQVQRRQSQSYADTRNRGIAPTSKRNVVAESSKAGQILDEEQLAVLADPDCDDLSSTKAVLMANLSSCNPEVLFKDTNPSVPNDLLVLSLVEQMIDHVAHLDKENQTNKMVNESLTAELE
uniref:Integrase, catalytic region, zinc finger, CCHC-type, peptidase aspartic, catalytic n=1 Tax=Tanacetum cinerariifolium TaxID=118510 RepID=A0A699J984_TANCI|nr:hypothetical protein [Tanacetum cinerariifolium]